MRKLPFNLGWLVLAIAAIGLTAYIVSLRAWERDLANQTAEMKQRAEEIKLATKRGLAATFDVRYCLDHKRRKDRQLQEMLRASTSRGDFIVREGPRIAWSKLAGADDGQWEIGLYLPEGKHTLHAALAPERGYAAKWELGPQAEVYEIHLHLNDGGGPPLISVLGAGNAILPAEQADVHERGIPCRTAAESGLAFPSELGMQGDSWSWQAERWPPVTELACASVAIKGEGETRLADLRLWIESDAPPCMSAVEAAAYYKTLTEQLLPAGRRNPRLPPDWEDFDGAFSSTFKPYDGSDRLYFRDDVVEYLQKSRANIANNHMP
jgi:hypothetical protein